MIIYSFGQTLPSSAPAVSVKISFPDIQLLVCGGTDGWQNRILAQAQASLTTVELSSHLARIHCRLQGEIVLGDRHEKMSGNYFWFLTWCKEGELLLSATANF